MVAAAAADAVERRVHEAQVTAGVLVGESDQSRPQWGLALVPPLPWMVYLPPAVLVITANAVWGAPVAATSGTPRWAPTPGR